MCYVFSYVFQLSGALLLLLWSLKGIRKNAIDLYFPSSSIVERDDDNICRLLKEILQKNAKTVILSVFSFVDLIVGYLIAILSEKQYGNCKTFLLVSIFTLGVVGIEYLLAVIIAKKRYPQDVFVSYEELEKRGIATMATETEVNEMLDTVWGSDKDD